MHAYRSVGNADPTHLNDHQRRRPETPHLAPLPCNDERRRKQRTHPATAAKEEIVSFVAVIMISRTKYNILISFRLPGHERGCTVAGLWFPSSLAVLRSPNATFEAHSVLPPQTAGKGVAPQCPDLHPRYVNSLHYC